MDIIKAEHEAKIKAIKMVLADFVDSVIQEHANRFMGKRHYPIDALIEEHADRLMREIQAVEVEAEERWFAKQEASHEKAPF
jgi:hypothetical protein